MNTEWTTEKPHLFFNECLLATAVKIRDYYLYMLYEIKKIYSDDGWYWGILDAEDGVEWGDYDDLKADMYMIIPLAIQI